MSNSKTKIFVTDTVIYKAAQIWSMLPAWYKNLPSLDLFRLKIKNFCCSGVGYID